MAHGRQYCLFVHYSDPLSFDMYGSQYFCPISIAKWCCRMSMTSNNMQSTHMEVQSHCYSLLNDFNGFQWLCPISIVFDIHARYLWKYSPVGSLWYWVTLTSLTCNARDILTSPASMSMALNIYDRCLCLSKSMSDVCGLEQHWKHSYAFTWHGPSPSQWNAISYLWYQCHSNSMLLWL